METAESLWIQLGDVPIDDDGCIEEKFLFFEPGTDREEIWHWFEDTFEISVINLMYPKMAYSGNPYGE